MEERAYRALQDEILRKSSLLGSNVQTCSNTRASELRERLVMQLLFYRSQYDANTILDAAIYLEAYILNGAPEAKKSNNENTIVFVFISHEEIPGLLRIIADDQHDRGEIKSIEFYGIGEIPAHLRFGCIKGYDQSREGGIVVRYTPKEAKPVTGAEG